MVSTNTVFHDHHLLSKIFPDKPLNLEDNWLVFTKISLFGIKWWKNLRGVCKLLHRELPNKEGMLKELGVTFKSEKIWQNARSLIIGTGVITERSKKDSIFPYQTHPNKASALYLLCSPDRIDAVLKFKGMDLHIKAEPSTGEDVQFNVTVNVMKATGVIKFKRYNHSHSPYSYWPKDCCADCPMRRYLDQRYAVVMYPFFLQALITSRPAFRKDIWDGYSPSRWTMETMKMIDDMAPLQTGRVVHRSFNYLACGYGHAKIGKVTKGMTWDCARCVMGGRRNGLCLGKTYEYTGERIRPVGGYPPTIMLGQEIATM